MKPRLSNHGPAVLAVALTGLLMAALTMACGSDGAAEAPTLPPSVTPTDPPTATPTTPPTATPIPEVTPDPADRAVVVGSNINVWAEPRTGSGSLRVLQQGDVVTIVGEVAGQDWVIDGQSWNIAAQPWQDSWFEIERGGYVYSAWLYQPGEGETLPGELPLGERWLAVDTTNQVLTFYVGETAYFTADVSTGKPGYETPLGSWRVHTRYEDETMSSAGQGYPESEQYLVEHVLFTQYFSNSGHALHLNYWRPLDVFGETATSHGCVGLLLHDAQWLWLAGDGHDLRIEIGGTQTSGLTASGDPTRPGGP
ncbi:MAG: L,D-transpeptidase family protein [Dehalococcoidia bacterium]